MDREVVLISGSSRGIGYAIAELFARNNYCVVLNCKNNVSLMEEHVKNLRQFNPNVMGIQADISNYDEVNSMFEEIIALYNKIDIVINNAGISYCGLFTDMSIEDMQNTVNTNLLSVLYCSQLAAKDMLKRKYGSIINIGSIWGITGASCETVYSATKGAIHTFTKALAKELAPSGIRVNAIACGVIDTDMNGNLTSHEKEDLADSIPMLRFGKATEVANIVLFLAKKESSYINGEIIKADGGFI